MCKGPEPKMYCGSKELKGEVKHGQNMERKEGRGKRCGQRCRPGQAMQ